MIYVKILKVTDFISVTILRMVQKLHNKVCSNKMFITWHVWR